MKSIKNELPFGDQSCPTLTTITRMEEKLFTVILKMIAKLSVIECKSYPTNDPNYYTVRHSAAYIFSYLSHIKTCASQLELAANTLMREVMDAIAQEEMARAEKELIAIPPLPSDCPEDILTYKEPLNEKH